jgi:lipoyl(octanoyl) transferase
MANSAVSLLHRLQFVDWGLIDYREAMARQLELLEEVHLEHAPQTVVLCSHPPIVTLGRGTREGDVFGWGGDVIEVSRGGRATYHGPSQVVAYPIVNLMDSLRSQLKPRDLHGYLRALEQVIVETLAHFGVHAEGSSPHTQVGDVSPSDATGVWIKDRKIASIGIGVRRWVTYHGLAVNINADPLAFKGLHPCGFTTSTMVSLEELLGQSVSHDDFKKELRRHLQALLSTTN